MGAPGSDEVDMTERMNELEALFDREAESAVNTPALQAGVLLYRTKTIRSGDMLECVCYPIVTVGCRMRAKRAKISSERQRRANVQAARMRILRKAQCNFGAGCMFLTLTYERQPSEEEAKKELDRYLNRIRYRAQRNGSQAKYICVTEISTTGRVHHHMLIEGVTRAEAEQLWKRGYANTRQYQKRREQFKGLIYYMTKKQSTLDPPEKEDEETVYRRVRCSKGMVEPRETVADHKISIAKMERIARSCEDEAIATVQRLYPGYHCEERPTVRRSEWLPGAYMHAVLWRDEKNKRSFDRALTKA